MIGNEPNGALAVFKTWDQANTAIEALEHSGFPMQGVSVLGPGATGEPPPELDRSARHSMEVASFWARWGAIIGGGLGAAVVAIPLIAAVVGLGPFAPLLLAVPVGTAGAGAMASALVGLGVHAVHAHRYAKAIASGKFVVVAHTDDRDELEDARAALASGRPELVDVHAGASVAA